MNTPKRSIGLALAAVLLSGSVLGACSGNNESAGNTDGSSQPAAAPSSAPSGGAVTYPIDTNETLTYWGALPNSLIGVKTQHTEIPFYQEWQKNTGVSVEFTAPPANQVKETFNVMIASGELPDMVEYDFFSFPGGPEKAIQDGYILKLNDLIDQHAPNLKKYLAENPEIDKMVKTDSGSYYAFPFIRGDESLLTFQGPVIRKDWLDELGLPVPETIDEWTAALKAFKEEKGASAPISFVSKARVFNELGNGAFIGAFGVTRDFYLEEGQVKFGPAEPGYKEFLALFRQWYADGLLDRDVSTVDSKIMDANITSGATGATWANAGGGIGKWQPILKSQNPDASLVGAPYPVLNKGDIPKFGQRDYHFSTGGMVAVSGTSQNPELAVQMLDYGYSEEGRMFFNFGTEGVSYEMEGDYPAFTDLLMNNPDDLAPAQAMSLYIRGNTMGPTISDKRVSEQYLNMREQQEAIQLWVNTDMAKHKMPMVTPTPEESAEFAKIMTDVDTLVDEMTLKIILGAEPLDSYESYLEKLKSVKLDRAIEIREAALERYLNR